MEEYPYITHQFSSSLHKLELMQFDIFDICGGFHFKNKHFLVEITQI